ncbi:hypothetical protein C1645_792277 [Glomus cerebriforme]|uniref:Protein kinase domain-containing protein n=1 Tax=Glomus cerebriforme TaxID=658196 RepID=A0A397S8C9_9GLOM|nr:hypothetical protein C1645_792277 [Glomus cerebriforme]
MSHKIWVKYDETKPELLPRLDYVDIEDITLRRHGEEVDLELNMNNNKPLQVITKGKKRKKDEEEQDKNQNWILKSMKNDLVNLPSSTITTNFERLEKNQDHPPEYAGRPVSWFCDAFVQFHQDLKDTGPISKKYYDIALKLCMEMSKIYPNKKARTKAFDDCFLNFDDSSYGFQTNFNFQEIILENNQKSDGFILHHVKEALIGNREIKNEIGTSWLDPYSQGAYSWINYWTNKSDDFWKKRCCCPSFIISLAGPWMMISGAILLETPVVHPLTSYIPLLATIDTNNMKLIARIFWAIERGFNNLRIYYDKVALIKMKPSPQSDEINTPQHYFPKNTITINDHLYNIVYIKPLKDKLQRAKIYLAKMKYDERSSWPIIVKFTQQYNFEAHQICADKGYAPELIAISDIGDWKMIIMEYIDGDTLDTLQLEDNVFHDIQTAIQFLHDKDIVFGDLRMCNVMVRESDKRGMLIDFEWAGKENVDHYPPFMNHTQVAWPEGAVDDQPLKKEHDLIWLDRIKIGNTGTIFSGFNCIEW